MSAKLHFFLGYMQINLKENAKKENLFSIFVERAHSIGVL